MSEVTRILSAIGHGEPHAAERLLPLVYDELRRLAAEDPTKAQLVTLRYFAGLSVQEAADALGISRATADRYWSYARTWLYCELGGNPDGSASKQKLSGA